MDTITRFPIYIIAILRHNVSIIYTDFLFRTHCQTENGLWASVGSMQTQKSNARRRRRKSGKLKPSPLTSRTADLPSPSQSLTHSSSAGVSFPLRLGIHRVTTE